MEVPRRSNPRVACLGRPTEMWVICRVALFVSLRDQLERHNDTGSALSVCVRGEVGPLSGKRDEA